MARLLDGLRVFDLSIVTAGAAVTQVLADFGADVIKIEAPRRPDLFRGWTEARPGAQGDLYSPPFRTVNRGKRALAVDLKTPEGLDVAKKLLRECDVVVENFRQGVLDRLGLGFHELVAIRPDIVLVSISSQGTTGPNTRYGSFGSTLDALGGEMSITGYDEQTPLWSSNKVNYPDQVVGFLGPALVLTGVLAARASGQPQWIDVSQRELVTAMLPEHILCASLGSADPVPTANTGVEGLGWATRCAGDDEWAVISMPTAEHRRHLAEALGEADLARCDDAAVIDAVGRWSSELTKQQVMATLQAHGIPAAAVTKGFELHDDAFFTDIGFFKSVPLPADGSELQRGWIVRFQGELDPAAVDTRAPHVGEHTVDIMSSLLGYSDVEITRLLDSRVLAQYSRAAGPINDAPARDAANLTDGQGDCRRGPD
jgi:crotonobetainyl-CoA:carnitine CoA-transferase CaiB-like acyl-CoA transferase